MQHLCFCIAEDNILMRQIPELLFMTNTLETADQNRVTRLYVYKAYISSCFNRTDAVQNNTIRTHVMSTTDVV